MDILPNDILSLVVDILGAIDTYNLILTNSSFNDEFGKDKIKRKFYYLTIKNLVNRDFDKFQVKIKDVEDDDRNEIFIHTLHDIRTVWMSQEAGFYNMKYIFECMINGSRINNVNRLTNHTSNHFYKFFYHPIVNCIGDLGVKDREEIQDNVDRSGMLRSLYSNFVEYEKAGWKNGRME